ncbi:deoxyribodipyrimidine photo-lyase, partial [Micrococcus endophyticus]
MTTLLWLRDDLRTLDHEALTAACEDVRDSGGAVVGLWIREEAEVDADGGRLGARPLGAA